MSRLLTAIGYWLFVTFNSTRGTTPGEVQLREELTQSNRERDRAEHELTAVRSELAIQRRDMDLLNEIIERERARVKMETEYFSGEWKRGRQ